MKKVFLSLAVVAALTVVSCKQADANAEAATDSTTVEAVDTAAAAPVADTTAVDTAAAKTEAAPAAAAPAEKK